MKNTSLWLKGVYALIFIWLITYAVCIIYPLLWMFLSRFKSTSDLFTNTWALPTTWSFENYVDAWKTRVGRYFLNSVLVTTITVIGTIFISAIAAFALSRFEFRLKKITFILILGGLMLSPEVSLISLYKLLQKLEIYNTYFALIIPYVAFRVPFTVFLLRSYFISLPKEVEESAYMDGCGYFKIFWEIIMPMSKPILATASLLTAMFAWNEFMFALVFIESDKLKTIPVGLMNIRGAFSTNWSALLAGLAISCLPIIILFIVFQKQFVRGLTSGSVKG